MGAMEESTTRPNGRVSPPKRPSNFGFDVLRIGLTYVTGAGVALIALVIALRVGGVAATAIALCVIAVALLSCLAVWWTLRRGTVANRFAATVALWGMLSLALLVFMVVGGDALTIERWPTWARVIVALAPVIPVAGSVAALLKYLTSEPDEFQRMLTTRAVLWAMGATFVLLTGWSFLSSYVDAPAIPAPLVMGAFWIAFAITGPIVRWSYR